MIEGSTPQALAENAGTTNPGPRQDQIDAHLALQQEQMRQQIRQQRVNVAIGTMDALTRHMGATNTTTLVGFDEKLWDTCVQIVQDFLKPVAGLGVANGPRLSE